MCVAKAVNPWFGGWLGKPCINLFTRVSKCYPNYVDSFFPS